MPDKGPGPIGRLAMRVEGDDWVAYYALSGTMEGAARLGTIKMALVERRERKEQFMALMREAVADIIERGVGVRPVFPNPPERAPEHERAGRA